jgi:hypothetical protein
MKQAVKLSLSVFFLVFLSLIIDIQSVQAQTLGKFIGDETALYAMTKQMSQFFSRFNNEEDGTGKKYLPSDKHYRESEKRRQILPLMFDNENQRTAGALRDLFIEDLTGKKQAFFNFLDGRWYAEVSTTFEYEGKQVPVVLFLMIEKERLGSKWVLTNVYFQGFNQFFPSGEIVDKEKENFFLHPMSHELDFMNLNKVFNEPSKAEYFASNTFHPDFLTLFLYEVKLGHMKFVTVDALKFHIFQIKDWYFEVSYFNRKGNNTGWLISNLMYVKENEKEKLIKFYEP